MAQSDGARKQTFGAESTWTLPTALIQFNAWLGEQDKDFRKIAIWGNGATFDNVVLRSAYASVGLKPHWHFRGDKCYRTVINLLPEDKRPAFERHGTHHNALDDAITQARHLQRCMYVLHLMQHWDPTGARDEIGLTAESVGLKNCPNG
jgi:exodeoxyribonuclease VIII